MTTVRPYVPAPIIELLAIKLYEHDFGKWPPDPHIGAGWRNLAEEDRQPYRDMASGKRDIYK